MPSAYGGRAGGTRSDAAAVEDGAQDDAPPNKSDAFLLLGESAIFLV